MEPQSQIRAVLLRGLDRLGLELDGSVLDVMIIYFERLLKANESLNLISPKQDLETKVIVHLLDSLTPRLWRDWPRSLSVMDLGSGGGLPAIPLALCFPDWRLTLVEATGKKTAFLNSVKDELGLSQVQIINQYLESDKNAENFKFDLICARGVSDLKKLAALAGPRLKVGGRLLAFKGPRAADELMAATAKMKQWRLSLDQKLEFTLPIVEAQRTLLRLIKS